MAPIRIEYECITLMQWPLSLFLTRTHAYARCARYLSFDATLPCVYAMCPNHFSRKGGAAVYNNAPLIMCSVISFLTGINTARIRR